MSHIDGPGDEQSSAGAGGLPLTLDYARSYLYVFESANWVLNLVFATICQLIPVIGPILLIGYQFEIVETLHRDPRSAYPDFDFKNFVNYLVRGLWPFLVNLIVGLVISPIIFIMIFAVMIMTGIAGAAGGEDVAAAGAVVATLLVALVILVSVVLFTLVLLPFLLRAGLSQDFATAFNFAFVIDFIRTTWLEMILAQLFLTISGVFVATIGLLLCCVGVYPAATLVMLAQAHIYFQLYQLYLARGGTPIPLKEPSVTT